MLNTAVSAGKRVRSETGWDSVNIMIEMMVMMMMMIMIVMIMHDNNYDDHREDSF